MLLNDILWALGASVFFLFLGVMNIIGAVKGKIGDDRLKKKRERIFFMVMGIVLGIPSVFGIIHFSSEYTYSKQFRRTFGSAIIENKVPQDFYSENYKAVLCDATNKPFFSKKFIPKERQAVKPNDVKFILVLQRRKELSFSYSNGAGAYRRYYDITLKDIGTWETIISCSFAGSAPPKVASRNGATGDPPKGSEISEWIAKNIPR